MITNIAARNTVISKIETAHRVAIPAGQDPRIPSVEAIQDGRYIVSHVSTGTLDHPSFGSRICFYAPNTGGGGLVHEEPVTAGMLEWLAAQRARA